MLNTLNIILSVLVDALTAMSFPATLLMWVAANAFM